MRNTIAIVIGGIIFGIVLCAFGPSACNTVGDAVSYARPIMNGELDGRVESAVERGAEKFVRRIVAPMHAESMREHARTQRAVKAVENKVDIVDNNLEAVARCLDPSCQQKIASRPTPHQTATARASATTTVTAPAPPIHVSTPTANYKCGMEATGEAAVEAAKHSNYVECGPARQTQTPRVMVEDPRPNPPATVKKQEKCGKNLFHWRRQACDAPPPPACKGKC